MSTRPLLSRLAARLSPSGIRELEQLASATPGLISLGPGQPDDTLFPTAGIASTLSAAFDDPKTRARCLQYGPSQGDPELVTQLVQHMREQRVTCDASNILVTAGAQQALDLITQLLVDDGDTVLVQPETYPGALQVFRARGANVVSLEDRVTAATNHSVKFLYAMADFQNPTGEVLGVDARATLLDTARERNVFLVEDSPYREIRFSDHDLPPTLIAMDCRRASPDAGRTLYVGSFSKIIAPGLRVGWVVGPAPVISRLTLLRQGSDLQPGTLSQRIVAGLLERGMGEHIVRVRRRYTERRDALLDALHRHLRPYATWTAPEGGFFVWVKLNGAVDTAGLLHDAIRNGIAYVPGTAFRHDAAASSQLRLSFSSVDPASMNEAIRRLAVTIAEALKHGN